MAKKESDLGNSIRLEASRLRGILIRVNAGVGVIGDGGLKGITWHKDGAATVKNARIFHGVPKGVSDYIGFTEVEITPEMVGEKMAVFVACETKTGNNKATKEQRDFLASVAKLGGIAVLARKAGDLIRGVGRFTDERNKA